MASTEVATPAIAAPTQRWMVSPGFDLFFFIATAVLTLAVWAAVTYGHARTFTILGVVAVVSNGPHLVSTWTRVYFDGEERFRRPSVYWLAPLAITAWVTASTLAGDPYLRSIRSVLFYWAVWHFVQQNWGILRIYQRKAGEADLPIALLERAILWLGVLWPMSIRILKGPLNLFGSNVSHPTLQPWMTNALAAALIVAVLAYVAMRVQGLARGERCCVMQPLFLAASALAFYVPFVMVKNGTAAFATAALWHGLQYIAIVWFYNRNKWKSGVAQRARLVSWISQPGRTPLYFMTLLAIAGIAYGSLLILSRVALNMETWSTIVWTSLTFSHYWVDGFIWKLRRPELRQNLGAQA